MHHLNLILHCGGETVERNELGKVETPEPSGRWHPIGHADFVNMVQDELENFGLRVMSEAHGLTPNRDGVLGGNYFGMFQIAGKDLEYPDHSTVVGLRNSHIKRLSAGLALGSGVFVCDNLAFMGEITIARKHTKNILGDDSNGIRPLIAESISKLVVANKHQERRFEAYKSGNMSNGQAEVFMIDAFRNGVITPTQLPKVVEQWDTPDHAEFGNNRNGWRMFNAVTEALKGTSPLELPRRTAKLHKLMDETYDIEPLDTELLKAA